MKEKRIKISNILRSSVYILYILLFSVVLVNLFLFRDGLDDNTGYVCIGVLIAIPAGIFALYYLSVFSDRFPEKALIIALLGACFVIKLIWVLANRVVPIIDYKTYFDTAADLSSNLKVSNPHIALFPHLMGYALFLSAFFKTIGVHLLIPPVLNVILSSVSAALLYYICRRLGNRRAAVICCVLWILYPAQTINNMQALSEPLYCTELLIIWAMLIYMDARFNTEKLRRVAVYAVFTALMLALFNMSRPIAPVVIISMLLWVLLARNSGCENDGRTRGNKAAIRMAAFLTIAVVGYLFFSMSAERYLTIRLGEKPAAIPGYNIYVGFNAQSGGRWNIEDYNLLSYYSDTMGLSADDAQRQMLSEAVSRIRSGGDMAKLIYEKFILFLSDDSSAVYYNAHLFRYPVFMLIISNVFYYFIMSVSMFGSFTALRTGSRSPLLLICLYSIGLIMAQMLVEVASRYHYSITLTMIILASCGVSSLKAVNKAVLPEGARERRI